MSLQRAWAYTRTAPFETGNVYSRAYQLQNIEKFCRKHKLELTQHYHDFASGRKEDRPELHKAARFSKRAKVLLIAWTLDRLSERLTTFYTVLEGVQYVTCEWGCVPLESSRSTYELMWNGSVEIEWQKNRRRKRDNR